MIPYLLPIILILYGEFSKDIETRYVARNIFYSYALYQLLTIQLLPTSGFVFLSALLFSWGVGYAASRARNVVAKVALLASAFMVAVNSIALFTGNTELILQFPLYAENSHFWIRESLLTGLASFAIWRDDQLDEDWKLGTFVIALLMVENFYF
ncbi:hypothetical protein [Vibrio phage RYC]|nr:hypothetical protein [Vibrio phage RYC]